MWLFSFVACDWSDDNDVTSTVTAGYRRNVPSLNHPSHLLSDPCKCCFVVGRVGVGWLVRSRDGGSAYHSRAFPFAAAASKRADFDDGADALLSSGTTVDCTLAVAQALPQVS